MIDIEAARELLDFNVRIHAPDRAQEQLEGAVALHNMLEKHHVAYLADEVGMGKTYVALGALALFRHYNPAFRVLVIAPRKNIQKKWINELHNFVRNNVRYPDFRVKALDGHPVRQPVFCDRLLDLMHESTLDPNRDFFARMTSFSLGLRGREEDIDPEEARKLRDDLEVHLPWLPRDAFDLRNKEQFKDNLARAACCALPVFDLVIVDEAHALKHGLKRDVATRNRMLNLVLGFGGPGSEPSQFRGYRPKAKRVLYLSATPIEETYQHLWNQLSIFNKTHGVDELNKADATEEECKRAAARFLIRRVTSIRVGGVDHTKNLYRREWRAGGVHAHDEPIRIDDNQTRLIVALIQKKVSELLLDTNFGSSFQIGMLASFESFLETARKKEEDGVFDEAEQAKKPEERKGIDVLEINRIAKDYRRVFDREMPHPKMDALVAALKPSWERGRKSLVFVRRVASVRELRRRLNDLYDDWLEERMLRELSPSLHERFGSIVRRYKEEKAAASAAKIATAEQGEDGDGEQDLGGVDTFFAWFFRGEGPRQVISGANVQQRFIKGSGLYGTFFEDNYVADLLGCEPTDVPEKLGAALGLVPEELREQLATRAQPFLPRKPRIADRFKAAQAAGLSLLRERNGPWQGAASVVWHQCFEGAKKLGASSREKIDVVADLRLGTFFTALRRRPELARRLWPPCTGNAEDAFRERELRRQVFARAARLGHAFIDLYLLVIANVGTLDAKGARDPEEGGAGEFDLIQQYLDLLDAQKQCESTERPWGAFDELSEIAGNFALISDLNMRDLREKPLDEAATLAGKLLGRQQPVAGMSGEVNETVVQQFRMPGYPFVLITTDLLKEGEDLHTFCSSIYHYGISWTPSSMEQRIGRIDRVRSQTDRRLAALAGPLDGAQKLQVYFPYLEDTVEVLQVQSVLERMNTFLRLMHEGLTAQPHESGQLDTKAEFNRGPRKVEQITQKLDSAFEVKPEHCSGNVLHVAVKSDAATIAQARLTALLQQTLQDLVVQWDPVQMSPGMLMGTLMLTQRQQPFSLSLKSVDDRLALRCISPVGCVGPGQAQEEIRQSTLRQRARVGAILTAEERTYDLTVEDEVLLSTDSKSDAARLGSLLRRVVHHADILEQRHLPGRDEKLDTFRKDLAREGRHAS